MHTVHIAIRVMKYSAAVRERAAPWWRSDTVIAACPAPTASLKQKPSTVLSLYCTAVHCAFTAPQYIALAGTAFSEVHCCFPTKTCFPNNALQVDALLVRCNANITSTGTHLCQTVGGKVQQRS